MLWFINTFHEPSSGVPWRRCDQLRRNSQKQGTNICDIICAFASFVFLEQFLRRCSEKQHPDTQPQRHHIPSPRIVKLFERVFKHLFLFVLLQERIPLSQTVKLVQHTLEQLHQHDQSSQLSPRRRTHGSNARMIREHQPAHPMVRRHIRRPTRQRHLYRRRPPRNKVGQLSFAYAEQRLVYLASANTISAVERDTSRSHVGRVDVSLYDVEDGDVTRSFAGRRGYHAVFRL